MKKFKSRSVFGRISAAVLAFSLISAFTSCGNADKKQQQQQRGPVVAKPGKVMVIGKANPTEVSFWNDVGKGVSDAAADFDYTVDYKCANNDEDVETQKKYINEAIDKNYDAIVIAPNSRDALNDDLKKATDKNIKIISIDSSTDFEGLSCAISSSDNIAAQLAAREAAKQLKNEIGKVAGVGKVAIIGHKSSTVEERVGAFKSAFTNLVISDIKNPSYSQQQAAAQAENAEEEDELIDPSEAAQKAAAEAKKKGEDPDKAAAAAAQEAAKKLEAAQAKKAALAAEAAAEGGAENANPENEKTDAQLLDEINKSYYLETDRCNSYMEAYHSAMDLLDKEGSNIKIMYGTNTNSTLGICIAVDELGLKDDIIVVGFNTNDKLIAYMRSGILDATILQNPYTMGYSGVAYAKRLIDSENIQKKIDTGVTVITSENINQPYVQLLLYPDQDIEFRLGGDEQGGQGQSGQGGQGSAKGGAPEGSGASEGNNKNGGQE